MCVSVLYHSEIYWLVCYIFYCMRNKNKTLSKMHSFSLRLSVYEVGMRAFTMRKLLHRQKGYNSFHTYWPPSALFLIEQQHLEQYCNDILSSALKMSLLPCRNRPILSWNSHNDAMKVLLYMLLVSVSHIHIHTYILAMTIVVVVVIIVFVVFAAVVLLCYGFWTKSFTFSYLYDFETFTTYVRNCYG